MNNSFEVPASNGCGGLLSLLVGPVVDSMIGLPSGKGSNSATLEGKLQDGQAAAVKASE